MDGEKEKYAEEKQSVRLQLVTSALKTQLGCTVCAMRRHVNIQTLVYLL